MQKVAVIGARVRAITDMAWIRLLLELTGVEVVALADPNDEGRTAPSKTRVRGPGTPTIGKC